MSSRFSSLETLLQFHAKTRIVLKEIAQNLAMLQLQDHVEFTENSLILVADYF